MTRDGHALEASEFAALALDEPGERLQGTALGRALRDGHLRDLAVLLRDALLLHDRGTWVELGSWASPLLPLLDEHGIDVVNEGRIRVRVQHWNPAWLDPCPGGVGSAAARREQRRRRDGVDADFFLQDYPDTVDRYRTPGQRSAVRAAMLLGEGETLLIALPTGAGKTLAALAPYFLQRHRGVTVIVVPTTSLALDHERRLLALDPRIGQVAYRGEGPEFGPDARRAFRKRLRNGLQQIVITSPEAIHGSLAHTLLGLAGQGRLHQLVVDEAHIVEEWGGDFRPEFQSLAALRRRWCTAALESGRQIVRTLLLTGTLRQSTFELLEVLFSDGEMKTVLAPALRPEPSFHFAGDSDPSERDRRLLEAAHHLPRPLIVFTTRVRDDELGLELSASAAHKLLREAGYERTAQVDGKVARVGAAKVDRQDVIQGLLDPVGPAVDIVVANSAFGLGVDVAGIRSVVHACVPESVDRYYQEVGRAGRDGYASVAILLATQADWTLAARMGEKTVLRTATALERWRSMWAFRSFAGPDSVLLSVTRQRPGVPEDSATNQNWNRQTLLMIALAGLVWIEAPELLEPPPGADADVEELESAWDDAFKTWSTRVLVRHRGDHWPSDQQMTEAIGRVRQRMSADRDPTGRLRELVSGGACASQTLVESYALELPGADRWRAAAACGGCPHCRRFSRPPWAVPLLRSAPPVGDAEIPSGLDALKVFGSPVWVWTTPADAFSEVQDFVLAAVRAGVRSVVDPERRLNERRLRRALQASPDRFLVYATTLDASLHVPTLVLPPQGSSPTPFELEGFPFVVVVMDEATPDPRRPDRLLKDMVERSCHLSIAQQGIQ